MNKPNKAELEYFIRYSLDSDKYKRYMELYEEIEKLNNIISNMEEELMTIYVDFMEYNEDYAKREIKKLKDVKK